VHSPQPHTCLCTASKGDNEGTQISLCDFSLIDRLRTCRSHSSAFYSAPSQFSDSSLSEEQQEMLAQSFCKIPNISLEEEWHRRLIVEPWQPPPQCTSVPELASIVPTVPSSAGPNAPPILTLLPTGACDGDGSSLSFIYMNESLGNWSRIPVGEGGAPLPSETGVLHCVGGDIGGGKSNLVMRFVARPEVRRIPRRIRSRTRIKSTA
jgi:hypothetical protein